MGRGTHWSMDDVQKMAHYVEDGVRPAAIQDLHPEWPGSSIRKLYRRLQQGPPPRKAGSGLGR